MATDPQDDQLAVFNMFVSDIHQALTTDLDAIIADIPAEHRQWAEAKRMEWLDYRGDAYRALLDPASAIREYMAAQSLNHPVRPPAPCRASDHQDR
jgi:hypothetical protein